MDTLGHADAPAAYTVMGPSDPLDPRREGTISMEQGKCRESSAEVSRHRHLMSAQLGFSSEVDRAPGF